MYYCTFNSPLRLTSTCSVGPGRLVLTKGGWKSSTFLRHILFDQFLFRSWTIWTIWIPRAFIVYGRVLRTYTCLTSIRRVTLLALLMTVFGISESIWVRRHKTMGSV
jgi:hypothetical protein